MRIIAGFLGGRTIKAVPGKSTRPTLDKVKESLFNALGQFFSEGVALDLYAGSGNLGIESISRGIEQCVLVDKNFKAYQIIKENVKTLKIENQTEVYKMDAFKALDMFEKKGQQFDVVFLDPPYKNQKINTILTILEDKQLLKEDARIIVECLKEDELLRQYKTIHFDKEYNYGIMKISIYKKNGDYSE